jgi:hypothetical protein
MFAKHGWPNNFDRKACWVEIEKWSEEYEGFMDALLKERLVLNPWESDPVRDVPRQALDLFLQTSAGELAVIWHFKNAHDEL